MQYKPMEVMVDGIEIVDKAEYPWEIANIRSPITVSPTMNITLFKIWFWKNALGPND